MSHGSRTSRARTNSVLFLVASILSLGGLAYAEDGRWVTPDGQKIPLTRSRSELGVKLRSREDLDASSTRMESAGLGKLRNFPSTPQAQFKILQETGTDRDTINRLRQDPAIEGVYSIYRFEGVDSPVVGTRTIVAKVNSGLSPEEIEKIWSSFGIIDAVAVKGLRRVYTLSVPEGQDELLLAETLADDARTEWAQPNFRREYRPMQSAPSDQYFPLQWHLENTGQSGGTSGADISALDAWDLGTGEGIIIGMFDDSCDVDHEDLKDRYIGTGQDVTRSFFDADYNNPRPKQTSDAHGTAVMGLAVASANNLGVRGVAFNAKFTASRGLGNPLEDGDIASAFTFAIEQHVDVHINSWGPVASFPTPAVIRDAIVEAATQGRDPDGEGPLPPRGMVILFSSGNEASEIRSGIGVATIPEVIAVGASTEEDFRAGFSNFGESLSVIAPGAGIVNLGITTTDTEDRTSPLIRGYNAGGQGVDPDSGQFFGLDDIDISGKYTGFFGGTSAACPIAAGVAALVLSINPDLTAKDVRLILEHTSDRVHPEDALYDPVTSHSFKYGYGRVNAGLAALAAKESLTNGDLSWPSSPLNAQTSGTTLTWSTAEGTDEFLVLESQEILAFAPVDGECYGPGQANCPPGALAQLPPGVSVLFSGCDGGCVSGVVQSVPFERPQVGTKIFFIYARNSVTGRYSFGARASSEQAEPPAVTILASTLEGDSPLTVNFRGNAVSSIEIDDSRTTWDFDVDTPPDSDSNNRTVSHTYEVADGQTKAFIARLTMYDANGTPGSADVAITVHGQGEEDGGNSGIGSLQIIVGLPGTPDSNVSTGKSPFQVVLTVDSTSLAGTLQAISWDLGDGTTSSGLVVPHTYTNDTNIDLRIPVTATVTTATSPTTTVNTSATRIITVQPGSDVVDPGDVDPCELPGTCAGGPGGGARPCGLGILPVFMLLSLGWVRRSNQAHRSRTE